MARRRRDERTGTGDPPEADVHGAIHAPAGSPSAPLPSEPTFLSGPPAREPAPAAAVSGQDAAVPATESGSPAPEALATIAAALAESPPPAPADPVAPVALPSFTASLSRKMERAYARAEQWNETFDARAMVPPPPAPRNARRPRKLGQGIAAVAAVDWRRVAARIRTRLAAWRSRRRHRGMVRKLDRMLAMVRKLDRMLARREARVADQSSAALLAVLTERVARMSTSELSVAELEATTALAQRVADEYRGYVARLAAARDAESATPALRDKATAELARCEAGLRRIDDALGQLRALAKRQPPRPAEPPSRA